MQLLTLGARLAVEAFRNHVFNGLNLEWDSGTLALSPSAHSG